MAHPSWMALAAGAAVALAIATTLTQPRVLEVEATAYCLTGATASGVEVERGMVAADPDVLPLGSRIRVEGLGEYDGDYRVEDTGHAIRGREIDIFIRDCDTAERFGRQDARVEVLEIGEGR